MSDNRHEPTRSPPADMLDRRELLSAAAGIAAGLGLAGAGVLHPVRATAADHRGFPYDGLRDYIRAVEDNGLLLRVPRIDQDRYEATALMYRLIDEFGWYGAPALLMEEVRIDGRWMRGPVLSNHQGHWDMEALVWGRAPVPGDGPATYRIMLEHLYGILDRNQGRTPTIPTREVASAQAPVKELVFRGNQVNLLGFPFLKSNPGDSARYVNTGSVFTQDPDLGMNFGTYRCEIKGPRRLGVNSEPGQTGWKMFMKKKERGEKSTPVSIVLGQDPITWIVSSSVISKGGADELAIAGGLRGRAVDVVKSETNGIRVPAHAEMVIEGDVLLDQWEPEGPFGEMYGYLGLKKAENFVMDVKAVTCRRNPWILNQFTGVTRGFCTAPLEAFAFHRLKKAIPNAVAFHSPVEWTGVGILAIDKSAPRQGLEAGRKIAQVVPITKICIVVDKDIDVLNRTEVMQIVGSRWQPYPAGEILREARGMPLDPSSPNRPMSSKIVIDATKQWPEEGGPAVYPERNRDLLENLAPESFDLVAANWKKYLQGWRRNG